MLCVSVRALCSLHFIIFLLDELTSKCVTIFCGLLLYFFENQKMIHPLKQKRPLLKIMVTF